VCSHRTLDCARLPTAPVGAPIIGVDGNPNRLTMAKRMRPTSPELPGAGLGLKGGGRYRHWEHRGDLRERPAKSASLEERSPAWVSTRQTASADAFAAGMATNESLQHSTQGGEGGMRWVGRGAWTLTPLLTHCFRCHRCVPLFGERRDERQGRD